MSKILSIFTYNVKSFFVIIILITSYMYFVSSRALAGTLVRHAGNNEFRYVVSLVHLNPNLQLKDNLLCTGSLISRSQVLLAEHCFFPPPPYPLVIYGGTADLRTAIKYYTYWFITYDQFAVQLEIEIVRSNDIAILHVIQSVPPEYGIVHVPTRSFYRYVTGLQVKMVGWGSTQNGEHSNYLQTVNTTIVSSTECMAQTSRLAGYLIIIPPEVYLCSKAQPYALLRDGDSGGPLLYENVILGINHATCPGMDGGHIHPQKMNVHVRLDLYLEFIAYMLNI